MGKKDDEERFAFKGFEEGLEEKKKRSKEASVMVQFLTLENKELAKKNIKEILAWIDKKVAEYEKEGFILHEFHGTHEGIILRLVTK